MADMSTPFAWDAGAGTPNPSGASARRDKRPRDSFAWPTPPYACYPLAQPQSEPQPCEIVGPNDQATLGRLLAFRPTDGLIHIQIAPARTPIAVRFDQFRALSLSAPLKPTPLAPGDPHAELLAHRALSPYQITLPNGTVQKGRTCGHVEFDFGVFLFPPLAALGGGDGVVRRMFVPRAAYQSFVVGPPIGELLVAQSSATSAQIEQAIDVQHQLRDRKLGDILVTNEVVSAHQLLEAIERQAKMPLVRIGEALLSLGMITDSQLKVALSQQHGDRSVPLGELLVRMGVVSREDLQVALSRKMGYPLVDLDTFTAAPEALGKLSQAVATRLRALPLLVRDGRLIVALEDPARRRAAVEEIEFNAQMKTVMVLARCRSIEAVLKSAYASIGASPGARDAGSPDEHVNDTDQLMESLEKEGVDRGAGQDDAPIEQSDNSLVRLLNTMIIEAHREGASDIHIESYPGREKIRVRFRKDGVLRPYLELPPTYRGALIARIKIMCDLDISERRKPQDGKINFAKFSAQHKLELRVATVPTNNGLEDVVMRILASAKPMPVERLGLSAENLARLKTAVERPYGMVLCVGPTGSGKTTTLHSAISHVNVPERKIWTAEDPVEITQTGLRQVQVNPRIDWTFAKALRAFLRADPDVIMVGEIRDTETASMAVEASLTGHLVLSTLHTNSAPETVTRLLDMGLDPFNFADALLAVLAQRLLRRLCTACRTARTATAEEVDELAADYLHAFGAQAPIDKAALVAAWLEEHGHDGALLHYHSPGCTVCERSGFRGRAGIHELMVISRELRRMVQTGARAEALQHTALAEGMRTLRQDGIDKVLAGVTTIGEVRATSNA